MHSLQRLVRERIRAYLDTLSAKPTQAQIGRALGRTQTWVSQYFLGRHRIDLDTLAQLCDLIDLDLSAVVDRDRVPGRHSELSEAVVLLQSLTDEERKIAIDMIRALAKRPYRKRART